MHQLISQTSLIHGWFPVVMPAAALVLLVGALWRRSPYWNRRWLPTIVGIAVVVSLLARWYVDSLGIAGNAGPLRLWIWVGLTTAAVGVVILGWSGAGWWRRLAAVLAVPLCAASCLLTLNIWVGYFPTVHAMWNQVSAGPLIDQTDRLTVTKMQVMHTRPKVGVIVPVDTGNAGSGFEHRRELVYLPPAWFASNPPPRLPTVMMIGSELNTPADWLRAGNALHTVDAFAGAHGGNAPVLVFVDATGAFSNDTECVDGPRGNAADHLVNDVVPYLVSNFGVRADRDGWGIMGWSMGGTCAVDLTLMHPDTFRSFVDIAGDLRPNSGDDGETVARLFGGDSAARSAYDPLTVLRQHGPYSGVSAWFEVPASADPAANPEGQDVAATTLCDAARAQSIACSVVTEPGRHDWPFAARAFATSLPWLAGELHTPGVGPTGLPDPDLTLAQASDSHVH